MKAKRIFAWVLVLLTVVTMLAISGCSGSNSEENVDNSTNSKKILTLNMYIVTDEKTDSDAARQVQMEINKILLPEYKTMLKINYLSENEYWDELEKTKDEVSFYQQNGITVEQAAAGESPKVGYFEEVSKFDSMTFNEVIDYLFEAEDIELEKPQFDIFVVNDYEKYKQMAANGELYPLDEYLASDRKVLKQYIHPTFLTSAKVEGVTYAIPTNHGLEGEFTYFVFNKDLLDKYGYTMEDLSDFTDLGDYLELIKRSEPGVWPISEPCSISGSEIYEDAFISINTSFGSFNGGISSLFMEMKYVDYLKTLRSFTEKAYFPQTKPANAKYAIEVVRTSEVLEREWTENGVTYTSYMYDIPKIGTQEAFKSAMCVSSLCKNPERAIEVITLFNTDSELANLLTYGIEGVNYYYDKQEGYIEMYNDSYVMDTLDTGNTYIKHQFKENLDYVENSKYVNNFLAPSAFLGFNPGFTDPEQASMYDCVLIVSKAAIENIENGADIDAVVLDAQRELRALGYAFGEDGKTLTGVFGKVAKDFEAQKKNTYRISDEIKYYNNGGVPTSTKKDNKTQDFDEFSLEFDGVKLYDLQAVCKKLYVSFDAVELDGQTRYAVADGKCLAVADSTRYICDGVPTEIDVKPVITEDGKVFVPAEFISVLEEVAVQMAENTAK